MARWVLPIAAGTYRLGRHGFRVFLKTAPTAAFLSDPFHTFSTLCLPACMRVTRHDQDTAMTTADFATDRESTAQQTVDTIPVRFVPGDIESQREAYLMMFRLVVGHALAAGRRLRDIADTIGVSARRLAEWISGRVNDIEVEEMSRKCIAFARQMGLALESVHA